MLVYISTMMVLSGYAADKWSYASDHSHQVRALRRGGVSRYRNAMRSTLFALDNQPPTTHHSEI